MPNKTIYLNTIKEMEEKLGRSFIDVAAVATKLQNAWKEDTSENKTSFLNTYGEVFRSVMKELGDYELSLAYDSRAKDGAKLRTALLNADETMKMCALALIPELRQDQATLTNMTFGAMNQGRLTREFLPLRAKYLSMKRTSPAMKKYKAEVYEKYKKEWENTSIRKITERIRDKTALKAMSQDEKIDFAVALNIYRNDKTLPRPLGSNEAEWIDDALNEWKRELGCLPNDPIDELAANRFFQYGATIGNEGAIDAEVNAAFEEYNKRPTPAQKEIDHFNEVAEITAEFKRVSEQTIKTEGFTDEVAQGVNDFFWDGTETEEEREQREAAEKKQKEHTIKNEGVTDDTAEM
ncbi:MAG: hypothetical protein J6S04_05410, partial [Clostridia bacterium]|nr:hypothetical protein [Clostridia bacterium]